MCNKYNKKMYTLTLQIESPTILQSLKKICCAMNGVKILNSHSKSSEDIPNATTAKAIDNVRNGKTFSASSTDDLFKQILGVRTGTHSDLFKK